MILATASADKLVIAAETGNSAKDVIDPMQDLDAASTEASPSKMEMDTGHA